MFNRFQRTRNGEKPVGLTLPNFSPHLIFMIGISTRVQPDPEEREKGIKEVNGVKYHQDVILGVPVVLPA